MATGRLEIREFKKGKAVHIVWTNAKGTSRDEPVPSGQLSADLASLAADKSKLVQLGGVEVEFDEVGGKPQKVRRAGTPWQPPVAIPARPQQPRQQFGHGPGPARASAPQLQRGEKPAFRNPYNFIPAPPRPTAGPLADGPPCGHNRYHAERFTGTIGVRLTTVTPLLIADGSRAETSRDGHKSLPLRIGPDGRPCIPPTSVKGMLRAAFEAVTNSRFGVFGRHDERLAYRSAAQEGLALVPAIVADGTITLQRGTTDLLPSGRRPEPGRIQHAAWLPRYKRGDLRYPDGKPPQHGDVAWCWITRETHRRGFGFWGIMRIARTEPELGPKPANGTDVRKVRGHVCITNENIGNKHDERVFFEDGMQPVRIPLTDGVRLSWKELIRNYQATHEEAVAERRRNGRRPEDCLGREPGKTAWSRHVYEPGAENLDGRTTLCHALVEQQGGTCVVKALYPVMISRKLYDVSPRELLEAAGKLVPAESIQELSPADRVFGWVSPKGGETEDGAHAYRGNLRVGPVACHSADSVETFGGEGLPLAILGQPKPQQGRFYVAASPAGDAQDSGLSKQEAGYSAGKGLRGRKVYPHQAHLRANHWENPLTDRTQVAADGSFQEYRRPGAERDNQNRSIDGWVKPGVVFTFDLHVTNLSAEELGALLWLLRLSGGPKAACFRLGGGKPLGFGSVRLEIGTSQGADATACRVASGAGIRESYRSLALDTDEPFDPAAAVAAFERAVVQAYPSQEAAGRSETERFRTIPFIRAFVRSVEGFDDGLPVHYPRARPDGRQGPVPPHPEGRAYEWFVANEREGRDAGPHSALGDLANDPGLPMLDAPKGR